MTMITGTIYALSSADQTGAGLFEIEATEIDGSCEAGLNQAEIPDWVYRKGNALGICSAHDVMPARNDTTARDAVQVVDGRDLEPYVSDQVHGALRDSGFPLQHIRCWCDEETLILRGNVTRYFYAQMALELSLRFANGRRIEVQIRTVPVSNRDVGDL